MPTRPCRRARIAVRIWAPCLFSIAVLPAAAQPREINLRNAGEADPPIQVDVRLVVLHATVRDPHGALALGLDEKNFRVTENGEPQIVRVLAPEDTPAAIGLVVDNSGSMRGRRQEALAAALTLARASNPADDVFIVNFNERPAFALGDTKLFSASIPEMERALLDSHPEGRTALYEAIAAALAHVRRSGKEQRALVVISDGADNASRRNLRQILLEVAQADVAIYASGLYGEDDSPAFRGALHKLAQASGGEAFVPDSSAGILRACDHIARAIRTQYTLAYSPTNPRLDGTYRAVKVTTSGHSGKRLTVRTRAGYVASPEGSNGAEARR